jgi:uracil-DNA glycosylase
MTMLAEPALSLSLNLDKRQRAMLKEMGVQVWQPLPTAAVAAVAPVAPVVPVAPAPSQTLVAPTITINSGAASAHNKRATGTFDTSKPPFQTPQAAPDAKTSPSPNPWRVGQLQTLYTPSSPANSVRWLVLIESPASALQEPFNPFEGDAGKLLDNMLRAAKLHTAGAAMLAPLVRGSGAGGDLGAALGDTFASARADIVLVMGRLAAQALLQSDEPLAKLRGQVHTVTGVHTIVKLVVTLDPAYLLRNPLDKAKAWDDLCLGLTWA